MTLAKRSVMTLFSGDQDIYSHSVRIVLSIKGVTFDTINVDLNNPPEDFLELNPYQILPTLIDRELVLYQPNIIKEYLDERLPHPPLFSVYPINRAKSRLMIFRIEQDWYSQAHLIEQNSGETAETARRSLADSLTKLAPVFNDKPYFLSNDFSLVDCCIAPLLWRLPALKVALPARAKPVMDYAERVFALDAFQASLTDAEREMRE